jgi:hypothetical protein
MATGSFGVLDKYNKREYTLRVCLPRKDGPSKVCGDFLLALLPLSLRKPLLARTNLIPLELLITENPIISFFFLSLLILSSQILPS